MEIHRPKAARSWREFCIEIATIICGILIALGLEQGIEWLHWRHEAHVAREALSFDFRRLVGMAAQTDAYSPCVARRLGEFSDALDQAQTTARLPPMGFGGMPLFQGWSLRSLPGITAGQTLAHLSNHDQLALSYVVASMDWARADRDEASRDWGVLHTMIGPGRPTSDAEIASLRAALGRAAREAVTQRGLARQIETVILRSALLPRADVEAAYKEGLAAAAPLPMCRPPDPPPADSRFILERELLGPPRPPGAQRIKGVGVGGAFTTER